MADIVMNPITSTVRPTGLLFSVLLLVFTDQTAWCQAPQSTNREPAARSAADGGDVQRPAADEDAAPIREVVLFRSGVAYFQRRATVEGDSSVTLSFETKDIDDLLKSMVVRDLGGGQIATVNYDSKAPIGKLLKNFAIDLSGNPSLAELLEQLRGVAVEVAAPQSVSGVIMSIEQRQHKVGDELQTIDVLNLRTKDGLKRFPLEQITRLQIRDKRLDEELSRALRVLGSARGTEKKKISFSFTGDGQRDVHIGYVQQMPVWKMAYRLVLDGDASAKDANGKDNATKDAATNRDHGHLLQGWAIVENTTGSDWNDVRLSLISGRPISFVMPLYEPLFADRPKVQFDLYASLRPQTYEQALTQQEEQGEQAAAAPAAARSRAALQQAGLAGRAARADKNLRADLKQTMQSRAQTAEVGELFQYKIQSPVSIRRDQSAMIPVISSSVGAEKLAIYNASVHQQHPLRGVRLTNSTDLFFMKGPVTVYDGVYAGDALLDNLPAGSERLISYAMDLELEISPESETKPQTVVDVRLVKGTLLVTKKQIREQTYLIKNSGDTTRTLFVEHPKQAGWNLVVPKQPAETTRDNFRFVVDVPAGETEKLHVETQRTLEERVAVTNVDLDTIAQYKSAKAISDETKQQLEQVISRKRELGRLTDEKNRTKQRLDQVAEDQERIRKNMSELDRNTELYSSYVNKLAEQEDEIGNLRDRSEQLTDEIQQKRDELDSSLLDQ